MVYNNGSRSACENNFEYLNRLLRTKEYRPIGAKEKDGLQELDIKDLVFGKCQLVEKEKLHFLASIKFSKEKSRKFPIEVNKYNNGTLEVLDGVHRTAYLIGRSETIWARIVPIDQDYHTNGLIENIVEFVNYE